MKIFKLPDLGEGLQSAEIREWHVQVGDTVEADQLLVSVETAKAIVDIPSPWSGRIGQLFGEPGATIATGGSLVGFIDASDDNGAGEKKPEVAVDASAPALLPSLEPLQSPECGVRKVRAQMIPAIRALAAHLHVDVEQITPTGIDGMVSRGDVFRTAEGVTAQEPTGKLSGIRKVMAESMAISHEQVAAVTIFDDADITAWKDHAMLMPRLVRAIVAGCRKEPSVNSWYNHAALTRTIVESVSIGIAVDMSEGLLVPVLKNAEEQTEEEIRQNLRVLIAAARKRTLTMEQLRGSTITLTNHGSIAGRYSTPMVLVPNVAILGSGRMHSEVLFRDHVPEERTMLPLSLTFDHRPLTGGEAGRFLMAVITDLEKEQ